MYAIDFGRKFFQWLPLTLQIRTGEPLRTIGVGFAWLGFYVRVVPRYYREHGLFFRKTDDCL